MFHTLFMLFQILDKREKKSLYTVIIILLSIGIIEIIGIASIIPIISIMNNPEILDTNKVLASFKEFLLVFGLQDNKEALIVLGAMSFSMMTISTVLRSYGLYLTTNFIEMRRHHISYKLLSGYLKNDFEFFLNTQASDLIKTILSEVDRIVAQLVRPIITMISYMFLLIFIFTFLLFINLEISIMVILVFGSLYSLLYLFMRKKVNALGEQTVKANKDRFAVAMEAFKNIKYVKFSNLETYYNERFSQVSHNFSSSVATHFVLNQVPKYIVELVALGGVILLSIFVLLFSMKEDGSMPIEFFPLLSAYAISAYKLQPAVQAIFNGVVSLRYGRKALADLYQAINEISLNIHGDPDKVHSPRLNFNKSLRCIDMKFCYINEETNVIDGLCFEVSKGATIGIIGSTGSGKSTFINLLLGLLQPTGGEMLIDSTKITKKNRRELQYIVGYVPQDVTLINASIYENIAFGEATNDIDYEYAEYCGQVAMIDTSFFSDRVGKFIGDDGSKISGGQRQRIGIARALYKKPSLLVLDEATSGLDPKTEKNVLNAISQAFEDLSIIMVTHHYANLEICNEVYELKDKKLNKVEV